MFTVCQVCETLDISRSTLLYYERIGLVTSARNPANNYRQFPQSEIDKLRAIKLLQVGGLSLSESLSCLQGSLSPDQMHERLSSLAEQIDKLKQAYSILQALSGLSSSEESRNWQQDFERQTPDTYFNWLQTQGFTELQALQIRWISKDMTGNDDYTERFYELFLNMQRQGPGDNALNLDLLSHIENSIQIKSTLDIGCGTGAGTQFLVENLETEVTALDNAEIFLNKLTEWVKSNSLNDRVSIIDGSMLSPPFAEKRFDLIWSEGSAYIMGFNNALKTWKPLLTDDGYLFISEMCWLTDKPDSEPQRFWQDAYPDMSDVSTREQQAQQSGFKLVVSKTLPQSAWDRFHQDMRTQLKLLREKRGSHRAYDDCEAEIEMFEQHSGQFGYQCFLLRKE